MFEELTKSRVGKLRIRSSAVDEPGLRLGLSNLLNRVDMGSGGLKPAEIMVVKKLDDPLPGTVPVSPKRRKQISHWQQAAQEQLRQHGRNAIRPVKGFIPGNSQSVIFSDFAELVSCLVLDLVEGNVRRHWWWQLLLEHIPLDGKLSRTIYTVLGHKVYQLPSVLDSLNSWRAADKVLQTIEPEDALVLTSTLARAFGHTTIAAMLEADASVTDDAKTYRQAGALGPALIKTHSDTRQQTDSAAVAVVAGAEPMFHRIFWRQFLSQAPPAASMGRERVFLLGLGLLFRRRPWQLLNQEFQQKLQRLWNSSEYHQSRKTGVLGNEFEPVNPVTHQSDINGSTLAAKTLALSESSTDATLDKGNNTAGESETTEQVEAGKTGAGVTEEPVLAPQESTKLSVEQQVMDQGHEQSNNHDLHLTGSDSGVQRELGQAAPSDQPEGKDDLVSVSQTQVEEDPALDYGDDLIVTRIGGVLYLINLMRMFELPVCFEHDWQLASRVGPWAILESIGRVLLNDRSAVHQQDPLWGMLAKLDGRQPGDELAASYSGADSFRMPLDWFHSIRPERETYRWSTDRERLHIWSSSGMLLVNVALNSRSGIDQVEQELSPYLVSGQAVLFSRTEHAHSPLNDSIRVPGVKVSAGILLWLNQAMPAIRYAMTQALGTESFDEVLKLPAKIYLSSSHVDLVASIDNISMLARLSGLDQNPGWVPEMGKVVLFHFD